MTKPVAVSIEASPKKSFATAVDWPGWSRSGKSEELALEALVSHADRYAQVAKQAGEVFPSSDRLELDIVERTDGGGGTEFGVPSNVTEHDRRPVTATEADRLARLVEAAWRTFDSIATAAPEELRKGPRGGGRDTSKIVDHVFGSEQSYASTIGIKTKPFDTDDRPALDTLRAAMLEVLRQPSDGSPIPNSRWTSRYAAHRNARHDLDNDSEIYDRTD
jgi:hypothetical protein